MNKDHTRNEGLGELEISEIKDIASALSAITDTVKNTFRRNGRSAGDIRAAQSQSERRNRLPVVRAGKHLFSIK